MRTNNYSKILFGSFLVMFLLLYVYMFKVNGFYGEFVDKKSVNSDMKFILIWTSHTANPTMYFGVGQEGFINRKCSYTNCYVTSDRSFLSDISHFDVIFFHGPEIKYLPNGKLPKSRSTQQKYVFGSMEPSHYFSICSNRFDGYFNWTWTYRIDSDARWGYLYVLDADNNVVGPKKTVQWIKLEDMMPVTKEFMEKLKTKRKAAAWLVSNCDDLSGRMEFALELDKELRKYDLQLDVYGTCGFLDCSPHAECMKLIDEFYYFYLAFENSFSEDYVTEKLLHALLNNAIPVVYGAANYTRFMPDGIYLNARDLGVEKLAAEMNELIKNSEQYMEYFKWHNHYKYITSGETPEHDDYCKFCALLNNDEEMKNVTIVEKFREWWNQPNYCTFMEEWYQNSSLLLYTHGTLRNTFLI